MLLHNGKQYARVSDIIRPFTNFSHIDPKVLERKALIGTSAHEAIAEDIAEQFPSPAHAALGYFGSYLQWKKHLNPIFVQSEQRYFDEDKMLTGQIDALIKFHKTEMTPILVDFKTSASECEETWRMQAHLYAHLLNCNKVPIARRFLFVKLQKDGSFPQVYPYQFDPNIYAKCMGAIDKFWKNNTK